MFYYFVVYIIFEMKLNDLNLGVKKKYLSLDESYDVTIL